MPGRYADHKLLSYCFHPRTVVRNGERYLVACGKCNGCLLHKSNLWSTRLQQELESNPYSVFATYTYNNKFLPTLLRVEDGRHSGAYWMSDHDANVRFNGFSVVKREDHILVFDKFAGLSITNDHRSDVINYSSKRDFQLYLKLLRKDLEEHFYDQTEFFRYFVVSEVGPTTLRNHLHTIFFFKDYEVSEYCVKHALYQNWQMCDKNLFQEHLSYSDTGTGSYLANYVNSINSLPSIYKHRELKPWRLSSKSPAIGFGSYDTQEIQESFIAGDGTYSRIIKCAGSNTRVCYSQDYLRGLFPKCYRYGELSFNRLLYVYGFLYREIVGYKRPYLFLSLRLSKTKHVADWSAMMKCYQYCVKFGCTPWHYLYVLDLVYYRSAMRALRMQYEYLERHHDNYSASLAVYTNLVEWIHSYDCLSSSERYALELFLEQYHIYDIDSRCFDDFIYNDPDLDVYMREVDDIVAGLQKMPKYNELSGRAPHIV